MMTKNGELSLYGESVKFLSEISSSILLSEALNRNFLKYMYQKSYIFNNFVLTGNTNNC